LEEANIDLAYLPDNITSVTTKSGSDTQLSWKVSRFVYDTFFIAS
jgi:hypothetical protein